MIRRYLKRLIIVAHLVALFFSCQKAKEEAEWTAQWIGQEEIPLPESAELLKEVSWIWLPNSRSNAANQAREIPAYFRKQFSLEEGTYETAQITLTSDNAFTLWVNGELVGENTEWREVSTFDFSKLLKSGSNLIAIKAENVPIQHTNNRGPGNSPAGLIAKVEIKNKKGSEQVLVTDDSWNVSAKEQQGWTSATFDDSEWSRAEMLDVKGLATWDGHDPYANTWYRLRKVVDLEKKPEAAITKIAVDSKYWLWINGKLVIFEGGLKRGPTPQDTYYDETDLAPYLEAGKNTIAVLVWHWGRSSFSHNNSGIPGFIFQMDGGQDRFISDDSWKISRHPSYGETEAPHPNYRLAEYNIRYDASRGSEDWIFPDFDDSDWNSCATYGTPPTAPWNHLVKRSIPLWSDSGLRAYVSTERVEGQGNYDTIIAQLPTNAHVTPYLRTNTRAGLLIDIRTDNYVGGSENNIRTEYITKDGAQSFEALAWFNGHYVKYAIPKEIADIEVRYRETAFDAPVTGYFRSDDPFLNILWDKSLRTLQVCMRDTYYDCPDRERAQWWGDAVIEIGQTFYALDRVADSLSKKAIYELVNWRKPDGTFYSPVPGGKWDAELPGQMLMSIGHYGFWNYFLHTGDTATIRYAYPSIRPYLEKWEMDDHGLVKHRSGDWDWGDWGFEKDVRMLDNCYYTLALKGALSMAKLVGNQQDISFYEERIASIKKGVNDRFWNGKAYRSPEHEGETDDRGHGLAVIAGIAEADKYPAISDVLSRQMYASPYTEKYVLEALYLMNMPEQAINRMKKRFEVMVDAPYATLLEGWGVGNAGYGGGTINHSWSGGPLILLSQYAAGVEPILPAYKEFQVLPRMGGLKEIETAVPSPMGLISCTFKDKEDSFTMSITVPEGSTCIAGIPVRASRVFKDVLIDDEQALNKLTATSPDGGKSDQFMFIELGAGAHEIIATYNP